MLVQQVLHLLSEPLLQLLAIIVIILAITAITIVVTIIGDRNFLSS